MVAERVRNCAARHMRSLKVCQLRRSQSWPMSPANALLPMSGHPHRPAATFCLANRRTGAAATQCAGEALRFQPRHAKPRP